MKFLEYTKLLRSKINYYDKIAQKNNVFNPFTKPKHVTLIWIDENERPK